MANEYHLNLTHFNSGLPISRTFLPRAGSPCTLPFCLYLVLCTQKNALKSAQFGRYNTTLFKKFSFPQYWVTTEVLLYPVYTLHEFIVLDNSVRLLYFHACFSVFSSCVHNCYIMDHTYHSHKLWMRAQSSSDEQKWQAPMLHSVLKYLNPLKKVMFPYYDRCDFKNRCMVIMNNSGLVKCYP